MPIEKRENLFYEILIRGVSDPAQGKLGDIAAAHYIEGSAYVDTDTGAVIQYAPGVAQVLDPKKAAAYLGDRFASFEDQLRVERDGKAAADAEVARLTREIAELEALRPQLEQARAYIEEATIQRTRDAETIKGLNAKIAEIEARAEERAKRDSAELVALQQDLHKIDGVLGRRRQRLGKRLRRNHDGEYPAGNDGAA